MNANVAVRLVPLAVFVIRKLDSRQMWCLRFVRARGWRSPVQARAHLGGGDLGPEMHAAAFCREAFFFCSPEFCKIWLVLLFVVEWLVCNLGVISEGSGVAVHSGALQAEGQGIQGEERQGPGRLCRRQAVMIMQSRAAISSFGEDQGGVCIRPE